ncbi:Mitochondrial inner membrane transporter, exports 2-oxoadipate and 2-oxoglutarate from the mitochond [Balamuthia mandrillaris]
MGGNDNKAVAFKSKTHELPVHKHIAAGAMAGLCEVLCMYPLDVVKTRLQLQSAADARYTSVLGTFKDIIKTEGAANFYRGIISPILAEAPKRAMKFSANEQYKKLWLHVQGPSIAGGEGKPSQFGFVACGAAAGMTEATVNCPFELVKVRMQARQNLGVYKTTMDAFTKIMKAEGVLTLYKGFGSMLWRNGVWNGAYFGTINFVKQKLPEPQSQGGVIAGNFTAGVISGLLATTINTPFDVVKSRIQNVLPGQPAPYGFTIPALVTIAREEGVKALWKGYVPKVMRLAPGGGIMLVAFDFFAHLMS